MAITRPGLSIDVVVGASCSGFTIDDTTGAYNAVTNPDGYGLANGPTVNNVTGLVILVTNQNEGWYLTYTFTISSGTITAATLGISGATATNILAELSSTVWPFITGVNAFDATADYGVTIPDLTDGIYQIDYTITGQAYGDSAPPVLSAFSYTTSEYPVLNCDLCSCIDDMFIESAGCDCGCDGANKAMKARYYATLMKYAAERGDIDVAINNFEKAQALCDGCGCGDC